MKFLFTCGGTAGHINPALGVAGRLRQLLPDARFLFIGAEGMMETELVPRAGFEVRTVKISNLSRSLSLAGLKHNMETLRELAGSVAAAKKILEEFRPDIAVGTGGYVCYPVLRAAHKLRIPSLVHESNAVPGLTTKLLSRSVNAVLTGFEGAEENYPRGAKVVFTGTPVRTDFLKIGPADARKRMGVAAERPLVLSVWGSLGSGHINGLMPEFMRLVCERRDFDLIHSAGKRDFKTLSEAAERACGKHMKERGVDLREYIHDMPAVMAAADMVMCRSGASTLGELAALGKPALLVPSPNVTNHHQEKNARVLERAGAAKVLLEGQFDAPDLYETVKTLLCDGNALGGMSAAMRKSGVEDATERIVGLILDIVK